jgi:hypothetical protein
VISSIQYNSYNGCQHCLNPGVSYSQGKRIYKYDPNAQLRTCEIYIDQVEISVEANEAFEGIKGRSCLAEWLVIPKNVILDYMHLSLEGFAKQILSIWFDSAYNKREFYLGNFISTKNTTKTKFF